MGLRQKLRNILTQPTKQGWASLGRPETAEVAVMERGHDSLSGPDSQNTEFYDTSQPGGGRAARPENRLSNQPNMPNLLTQPNIAASLAGAKSLAGGRLSQDVEGSFFGTYSVVLPPNDPEGDWWSLALDTKTLQRVKPSKLIELLIDLSPEVSLAVFQYLRFCNPGYEFVAYRKNPRQPDTAATKAVQDFIDKMKDKYGSFDVILGRLFLSAFLRGALLGELVLDEAAKQPLDFATPDPISIRFVRYKDPVLGWQNQLAQYQLGALVPLNRPTIRYTPVDPLPGSPYGRPLISPALFSTLFLLGLLHDLKRVIAQQGYPRLDMSIDIEAIRAMMTPGTENDPKALKAWVDATIAEIQKFYSQLEPEDAFVHTSAVELKPPVGVMNSRGMGSMDALIEFVERMAMRALKSTPLLMGLSNAGGSEADSNRQWEIHVAGIKSLQHYCESMLEILFSIVLQAQGIPGKVQFRFAELRAAELLRDAQTETLRINNEMQKYLNGWTKQDEASQAATGHPADKKEPRLWPNTGQFKGTMVAAANAGDPSKDPKEQQPNANPNSDEQGGSKKPKDKETDPKKADGEKNPPAKKPSSKKDLEVEDEQVRQVEPFNPATPAFQAQVEAILGRNNGSQHA